MKNYFVQTLCKVKKENYDPGQQVPIHEQDTYPMYQELQNLSYSTFKHFMEGDWEYVLLEEEVSHVFEVFQQNFRKILQSTVNFMRKRDIFIFRFICHCSS